MTKKKIVKEGIHKMQNGKMMKDSEMKKEMKNKKATKSYKK